MTAPERLRSIAERLDEGTVPDRTADILAAWALVLERIVATSPDDQADMALALARVMRRG
jgi:hypothetical protein